MDNLISFEKAKKLKEEGLPQGKSKFKYARIEKDNYLEIMEQGVYLKTIDVEYYDAIDKEGFLEWCAERNKNMKVLETLIFQCPICFSQHQHYEGADSCMQKCTEKEESRVRLINIGESIKKLCAEQRNIVSKYPDLELKVYKKGDEIV